MATLAEQHIQFLQEGKQEVVSESVFFVSCQIKNEKFRSNVKNVLTGNKFKSEIIQENLYLVNISDVYQLQNIIEQIVCIRKLDLNLSGTFISFIVADKGNFKIEEVINISE